MSWILVHEPDHSLSLLHTWVFLQLCSEIYLLFTELFIWVHLHAAISPMPSLPYPLRTQQGQELAETQQCGPRSVTLLTFWLFLLFCAFPSTLPIIQSMFLFCCLVFLQWIISLSAGVLIIHCFFILMKKPYSLDIRPPRAGSMQASSHLLVLWNPYSAGILRSIILPPLPLVPQPVLKGGHLKRESSSNMAYEFLAHYFTLKDILNNKRFLNKDLQ